MQNLRSNKLRILEMRWWYLCVNWRCMRAGIYVDAKGFANDPHFSLYILFSFWYPSTVYNLIAGYNGGGCCCGCGCFFRVFLLLCIQTLKTCLFTPTSAQSCWTCSSYCFCILHPTFSAYSSIFSFCSWVNFVLNRFFDRDEGGGGGGGGGAAPALESKALRSSLEDSVAPMLVPKAMDMGGMMIVEGGAWKAFGNFWRCRYGGDARVGGSGWKWGALLPMVSPSTSFRWKFRWQLQAAHIRASRVPSSPSGMNSPQPSTTLPPMLAAWFLRHSLYLTEALEFDPPIVDAIVAPARTPATWTGSGSGSGSGSHPWPSDCCCGFSSCCCWRRGWWCGIWGGLKTVVPLSILWWSSPPPPDPADARGL